MKLSLHTGLCKVYLSFSPMGVMVFVYYPQCIADFFIQGAMTIKVDWIELKGAAGVLALTSVGGALVGWRRSICLLWHKGFREMSIRHVFRSELFLGGRVWVFRGFKSKQRNSQFSFILDVLIVPLCFQITGPTLITKFCSDWKLLWSEDDVMSAPLSSQRHFSFQQQEQTRLIRGRRSTRSAETDSDWDRRPVPVLCTFSQSGSNTKTN